MIYVLGSINLDMIATTTRLPAPGETVGANSFVTAPGGKGANQALAAARAGAKVKMIGAIGSDDFANQALVELKGATIDLSGVHQVTGPTGIAIIVVDAVGENVIVIVAGANGQVDANIALNAIKQMSGSDILALVQEIPARTLRAALKEAKSRQIKTILNIAPIIQDTAELAELADIIVANETEFFHLIGLGQNNNNIKELNNIEEPGSQWARQNEKTLIVTLGGQGAIGFTPSETLKAKALDIVPLDRVGAGDTFCGYLAASLNQGKSLEDAMKTASVAGSLACLKPGAQPAIPSASEVSAALST